MVNWRELVSDGRYAEAEAEMLAETDRGVGCFPFNEIRATFYKNWGDTLSETADAKAKYELAEFNWRQWAYCSASGGEGAERMSEVHRLEKNLESLNADR